MLLTSRQLTVFACFGALGALGTPEYNQTGRLLLNNIIYLMLVLCSIHNLVLAYNFCSVFVLV